VAGGIAARGGVAPLPRGRGVSLGGGAALARGFVGLYLSVIVLLPLAAVAVKSTEGGFATFWEAVSNPEAVAALRLTMIVSLIVVLINAVTGTIIAWMLVRDEFRGKGVINALIDLPFALPTIVAGLTLIALYGPNGPAPFNVGFTKAGVLVALLFVTLPFVVRAVQPVLLELDREVEEAAASLGATNRQVFTKIIFPNLTPAILAGVGLGFARAVGEFGSVVLISGNLPFDTQVAPVFIFKQVESDNVIGASAVAVVLLAISFVVLLGISGLSRWRRRHDR